MTDLNRMNELEAQASALREQKRWCEARKCYEEMITLGLGPMDEAKILANIMQMYEKEGNIEKAMEAGTRAFDIVQTYRLYETNEGAHLRGFIRGRLGRLRGEPFPWHLPIAFFAAYFIGASLGAVIGSQIAYEGLTIRGVVQTDLRYGGAGIGAVIGLLMLARPLSHLSLVFLAIVGILNFALLCFILTEKSISLGIGVIVSLFVPIILLTAIMFMRKENEII